MTTKMHTPLGVLAISLNKMKELSSKQSELIESKELLTFNILIDSLLSLIQDESVLESERMIIEHAYNMGKLESKFEIESDGLTYFNNNFKTNEIK
jgi:hypothetical protein